MRFSPAGDVGADMNPLSGLIAPVLALLSTAVPPDSGPAGVEVEQAELAPRLYSVPSAVTLPGSFPEAARALREAPRANQVRIEQRLIIRVAPGGPPRDRRDVRGSLFADMPARASTAPRFSERRMGQCVAVAGIAGVRPDGPTRLMLFMRDQKIVSAALEKSCNANDFYSGFLVERSADGMLCAGRDRVLSRSGSNCSLGKLRQLVAVDEDAD